MPSEMKLLSVRKAQKTHPTGDPKFAVMQAFPAGLSEKESVRRLLAEERRRHCCLLALLCRALTRLSS